MTAILITLLFSMSMSVAYASDGESHFQLLRAKCEHETSDKLETSPQSPPLDVDDPATPGCNKWELNFLVDGDITNVDKSWDLPLLDMNFGVGDNLQIKYEVPFVNSQTSEKSTSGVGASKLGIKALFFENERVELQLATYPQVEFITPYSDAEKRNLADPGTAVTLPVLISKKIGETAKGAMMFTGNLGYQLFSRGDSLDRILMSAGVGFPISRYVAFMSELSTEQHLARNSEGSREQLDKLNVGILGSVHKSIMAFGSMGESIYSSDHKNHSYLLVGVRLLGEPFSP